MQAALALLALSFVLASVPEARAQHATMSELELLTDLKGAAPQSVVENATIMNMSSDGTMKVIQEGSNGWTCMDPGGAPMCADKAAMEWVHAWQEKGPRSLDEMSLACANICAIHRTFSKSRSTSSTPIT